MKPEGKNQRKSQKMTIGNRFIIFIQNSKNDNRKNFKKIESFFEKCGNMSYNCISNTKTTKKVENQGGKYYEKT